MNDSEDTFKAATKTQKSEEDKLTPQKSYHQLSDRYHRLAEKFMGQKLAILHSCAFCIRIRLRRVIIETYIFMKGVNNGFFTAIHVIKRIVHNFIKYLEHNGSLPLIYVVLQYDSK
jgi:hypothetical protein